MAVLAGGCRRDRSTSRSAERDESRRDAPPAPRGSGTGSAKASLPFASAGCEYGKRYPKGTTSDTVTSDGDERSFRVYVPPGANATKPMPLVLMFHGGGGSGRQLQKHSSRMDAIADREHFVTVYPDGTGLLKTWNAGGCCGGATRKDVDDVAFVSTLLDRLETKLCVDRRRVFAAGMSNGGLFSHRLACDLSERIKGIASVAGTDMTTSCHPTKRVAVLQIHGRSDKHVPWQGGHGCGLAGVSFTSVPDTMTQWRTRNGCSKTTKAWPSEDWQRGGDGSCERFEGCADRASVTLCTIDGGGHYWPGGRPRKARRDCPGDGHQSSTFSADETIWRHFDGIVE